MHYIVGLGNPGEEYKLSRHNTGRIVLADFIKKQKISEPELNKKLKALTSEGEIVNAECGKKEKFQIIFPETFMNKSGLSLKLIIASRKKAEKLIVVHDDIDLPLGKFRISVSRGSAGHRGVESVIRNIKTKDFIRIRVGISPSAPSGRLKKPSGKKMLDFIIGDFRPKEIQALKEISKKITSALEAILEEGANKAMGAYPSR